MELGLYTFADVNPEAAAGERGRDAAERAKHLLAEIELADQVGLDVFGLGEHHRPDYMASAPAMLLAAAAARTKNIRLTSAVTVLSSDDPVRVYQQYATLDLISNGRAEIMAGRGSFIESFPLFGYDLKDYNGLFEEKLELLLKINEEDPITWKGRFRPSLDNQHVLPRAKNDKLPVWIAVGGTPQSVERAGRLGLPVIFAIIGGFSGGGIGSFIFGVLNLLIGILLLSSPVAATLAVPFVFGILLLIEGVALIVWAFRVRA